MSILAFRLLNHLALPLMIAVMETCWLYPWAALVGLWIEPGAYEPVLSAISVFMLLIVASQSTYMIFSKNWPLRKARIALLALGFIAVLFALRIDYFRHVPITDPAWFVALGNAFASAATNPSMPVFATALGFCLWWRGITYGREQISFDRVERVFRLGIFSLMALLLIAVIKGTASFAPLESRVGPYVVGFFLVGLTCLSLARLEAIRDRSRGSSDGDLPFNRHWFAVVMSLVTILILLALTLGQLFSFDLARAVFDPIFSALIAILVLVVYVFAVPVIWSLEFIVSLVSSLIQRDSPPFQPPPANMDLIEEFQRGQNLTGLPPELIFVVKWAGIGIVALAGLLFLLRAVSRWYEWESPDEITEERDSVWTEWSLKAILIAWLRSLRMRLFGNPLSDAAPLGVSLTQAGTEPTSVTTIRQVYRQLLRLGAALGLPRARNATPYEYLTRLQEHLKPEEDLVAITEAYVRTRYSPVTAGEIEIGEVQNSWERVRAAAEEPRPPA